MRWKDELNGDSRLGMKKTAGLSAAAWCVIAVSALYWVCASLRAVYKPLWYDELLTTYVSQLPTLRASWEAVASGVDSQLPMMHIFVRVAHVLLGYGSLATRLPMMLGFWIMQLSLLTFLGRRLEWRYAVIGMIFPMLTFAWPYAFEARAYGIVLGCAGAILVAWQNAAEGRWRRWSLAAIAVSFGVVLACHPTAGVIALPFAAGELVRVWERRRVDWPMSVAFLVTAPILMIYPPLLSNVRNLDLHGLQPSLASLSGFYSDALKSSITPLLAAGIATLMARGKDGTGGPACAMPIRELVVLSGFVAVPIPFFAAGHFSSHFLFFPRYAVTCVIGVAGLAAVAWQRMAGGSKRAGGAALVILIAWLALARGKEAMSATRDPGRQFRENHEGLVVALAAGKPVATWNINTFLEADFYLNSEELSRLHYVVPEQELGRKYRFQDLNSYVAPLLGRIAPLRARVTPWSQFEHVGPFLWHEEGIPSWWEEALVGWKKRVDFRHDGEYVWAVERP